MRLATPEEVEPEPEPERESEGGQDVTGPVAEPDWSTDPVGVAEAVEANARIALDNQEALEEVEELKEQIEAQNEEIDSLETAISELGDVVLEMAGPAKNVDRAAVVELLRRQSEWEEPDAGEDRSHGGVVFKSL